MVEDLKCLSNSCPTFRVVLFEKLMFNTGNLDKRRVLKSDQKRTRLKIALFAGVLSGADMQNTHSSGSMMLAGKYHILDKYLAGN